MQYDLISQNDHSTILAQYAHTPRESRPSYQSEAELEARLLRDLAQQGYEPRKFSSTQELEGNLRAQLERLNSMKFSDSEWRSFYQEHIANERLKIEDKTKILQTDEESLPFVNERGENKNIFLLDRKEPLRNHLQVTSQLTNDWGGGQNRYDVVILVNGLPLVLIELKKPGINLKEAFRQIERYQKESLSHPLFDFLQIFIISNGTLSKYYSNVKRELKSLSDNYAFCITFSDSKNNPIEYLEDFTATFLAKRVLLNILTKYCVFNTNQELLIMRPYQICACERIIDKIKIAHNHKLYGSIEAGGYIWHSTGSGKTLTSFKTALIAAQFPFIYKVIFVVDRKDLDYQTQKEYDKFEKDAANSTKDTKELKRRLEDKDSKILITTIQKLSIFIEKYKNSEVFNQEIVFIFDECHRSQFGEMHAAIIKKFKKYYLFGFTGTPIFEENAGKKYGQDEVSRQLMLKTTQNTFGECLHTYNILDAIRNKNVLPFKVSYISTTTNDEGQSFTHSTEKELMNPKRISRIVSYVLEHFNHHTKRDKAIAIENQRKQGFNAIFATASIDLAKKYYAEFNHQIKTTKSPPLRVAIIYTYKPNEEPGEDEPCEDNLSAKESLREAIKDYNAHFNSNFSLENFDGYYKEISQKTKDKEIDLLIVVSMFLTGFDSKTINTLYVDKNLKHHSLLQAYSRTNRILNESKAFGNIICFRDLEAATDESIRMFSNDKKDASIALFGNFDFYFNDYLSKAKDLIENFEIQGLLREGEAKQKEFIKLFGEILKLKNILEVFDEFHEEKNQAQDPLKGLHQDYQSIYVEAYRNSKQARESQQTDKEEITFEIELIKQTDINVDYITSLLESYYHNIINIILKSVQASPHLMKEEAEKRKQEILKSMQASPSLWDKKDLIEEFINKIEKFLNSSTADFKSLFQTFIQEKKQAELEALIQAYSLEPKLTAKYLEEAFKSHIFKDKGEELYALLPKEDIFSARDQAKSAKRREAISKLKEFFERFKPFLKEIQ